MKQRSRQARLQKSTARFWRTWFYHCAKPLAAGQGVSFIPNFHNFVPADADPILTYVSANGSNGP
ncbi:MAG: hypothetical protein PVG88_05205, partial [Methyloceanibacter sp.]